jgi:hypothetical protein
MARSNVGQLRFLAYASVLSALLSVATVLPGAASAVPANPDRALSLTAQPRSRQIIASLRLGFSRPVDGLALAIRGPRRVPIEKIKKTNFEVYVANTGARVLAVHKYPADLWVGLYDSRGRQLSDPNKYGSCLRNLGAQDVAMLEPGEVLAVLRFPDGFLAQELSKGIYFLKGILEKPYGEEWPTGLVPLLRRYDVGLWSGPALISPAHRIVLR